MELTAVLRAGPGSPAPSSVPVDVAVLFPPSGSSLVI